MYKLTFFILAITYGAFANALATIVVPDLKVLSSASGNNIDESDSVQINQAVIKTLPKFSAAIRGALIKTNQFKVVEASAESSVVNYYLLGEINYIGQNEDSYPIKDTDNVSKQFSIEVEADFKLVRTKDNVIMANFSANGSSNDVKIVSNVNKSDAVWHHNIGKLVQEASADLASNVSDEMLDELNLTLDNEKKSQPESVVVTDVKVYQ